MHSNTAPVLDLETAKRRVIERMALAEVEADRQRIEREAAAARRDGEAKARRARAAKLQAEIDANQDRRDQLAAESAKLVASLVANFRERDQRAAAHDELSARLNDALGQPTRSSSLSTLEADRRAFAAVMHKAIGGVQTAGWLFSWLNHHAVLWA